MPTKPARRRPVHRRARKSRLRGLVPLVVVPLGLGLVVTAAAPGWVPATVQRGDTLWSLAQRNHTTVQAIKDANGLKSDTIYAGQQLVLPPGNAIAPSAPKQATAPSSTAPSTGNQSAAVVQAAVRNAAARYGVDPALALAIAFQESGFQMSVVSRTGAVGVMQLMPATTTWAATTLVGRPLNPRNLQDNVDAGVAYLRWLQNRTDRATAIGAYYQGLASIQKRGPYADTRAYVRSVTALTARFR